MDLETLKIDLKGLKEGANHLTFDLDDTYFKAIVLHGTSTNS